MKPAIPGKWQFSTTPGTSSTPSPSTPRNRWCYGWKQRLCSHLLPLPILINIALSSQSLSSLPPVRLCPQLLQVPLGCAGVQPQVRELDQQSVQRGVQVSMAKHHISEIIRCSVSRTATDSRDTVELGDYQQTVGWEVVNTKSRYSEVDT